jgi:class 3 adenylate cyclase/tetratricopeptide (TPR) repeat protein
VSTAALLRSATPIAYTPAHLAERILTTRSALEGEHKRLTVLFCDLADSSRLAQHLGPEAMYELLNRFFELALQEVHRYEGTINQFLGDGFMALFGAPLAIEHHERQALLAALGIRQAVKDRLADASPEAADPILARLGVNTGFVVVGKIGDNLRMDYTAVGHTTNVAARLQAHAAPGQILLSQVTFERVESLVEAEPVGAVDLKGTGPVVAHRLLGLRPSRSTLESARERPLSPFVGRDRELAALHDALAHVEAGRGQAVGIVGEPGIGKSRLLMEFRQSLTGRRFTYLEGRCPPYGASIPWLPVMDFLRANCRLIETDPPEVMATKLRAAVREVGLDEGDTAPYLLYLAGLKDATGPLEALTPDAIKARTFDVLRQLALRGSRLRPIIFVVEDLHWIDQTSEEFLASMADALAGAAILLVTTYRHGYTPRWIDRSYTTQIAVRPLGERASLELVHAVLAGGVEPETIARTIVGRGEGNPLFIEELARVAREHPETGAGTDIPETLHGVLAARIDRLPDESKRLLQIASVLGREFPARLLAAVARPTEGLDSRLRELTQLEFLYEQSWTAEPVYVFTHALTRDAAYAGLLESRRREYHAAAGRALETLHAERPDDVVEILAHHFGLSSDDDQAATYALRAATKARRRWANAEAVAYFEAGVARLARLGDTPATRARRVDALLEQSEVRFALGQQAEHLATLESIRDLVHAIADPPREATWHYWVGFLHSMTGGRPEVAIEHGRQALAIAETAQLDDIRALAHCCLAQVYFFAGELARARQAGEQALAVFETEGNVWMACRALAHLSPTANAQGAWEEGLAYCQRALEHGRAVDDLRLKISALIRTAATHIQRGDWDAGLRECDEALALGPTPFDAAAARAIRGHGLARGGAVDEGIAQLTGACRSSSERKSHTRGRSSRSGWPRRGYARAIRDGPGRWPTLRSRRVGTSATGTWKASPAAFAVRA